MMGTICPHLVELRLRLLGRTPTFALGLSSARPEAYQKLMIHEKAFILLPSSSEAIFFAQVTVRARTTIWHDIGGSKVLNNAFSFKFQLISKCLFGISNSPKKPNKQIRLYYCGSSPPGTFHILIGKFSYFIIRFLLNSSVVKSDLVIGLF